MKVLFLTQYFPPETGAPQNRLHSLANYISDFGAEVNVLTAMPNYPKTEVYEGYKGKWYAKEKDGPLTIYRSWIYVSKSKGVVPRLLNYFSFVFTALWVGLIKVKKHDVIICESPPLFLGITAMLLKLFKGSKLVFNVSDLWPESAEKLDIINNKFLLGISYKLEALIYKKSNLVSGQTQGIITNINQRFPKIPTHLIRNGIDTKQFNVRGNGASFRAKHNIPENAFVVAYAGIIGHAQGLEIITEAAKQLLTETNIVFMMVGDGPVKPQLLAIAEAHHLTNITFINSVPRSEMPDVIDACNCYVTPLRKNDLFLGAIPSKIFEPLYFSKPVLLGVDGEAKSLFVDEGKCALHFEPENATALVGAIKLLYNDTDLYQTLGKNGHHYVSTYFDRKKLAEHFWKRITQL
ncbi:MAG: glycosyltransferase family 4 protein [Bacteroidia bacterium]|nr:glycosyltransferase family 4 protein [Bacteroidia bacterium]MBP9688510.1 glycosyltransferase family 4 protein [Bacteroidia bacterium]